MSTIYVWKASDYPPVMFSVWKAENWLGHEVEFTIQGHKFSGIVESAERHHLANGEHDILTIEIDDNGSQVKIQAHRQKFRKIQKEK